MKGEFYKMDFRAWNMGTVDLTLEQEAAYLRLCHAMYDAGGPVPNSTRLLMAIFRCGNTKAVTLLAQLVAAGKIAVTADGSLFNHRVSEELANRERVSSARRVSGERGGTASGASRAKSLENNDMDEAIASTPRSREEERRGDKNTRDKPLCKPEPRKRASSPKFAISDDAEPNERQTADAISRRLPPDQIRQEWTRFRDFHLKHANRFSDWNAAWRNWLDSPIRQRQAAQAATGSAPPRKPSSHGALSRAADLLGLTDDKPANSSSRFDHGPVLDHEGDGRHHREVYEPFGGQAGRLSPQAALRLVSSGRH